MIPSPSENPRTSPGKAFLQGGADLLFGLVGVVLLLSVCFSVQVPELWHKLYFESMIVELVSLGLSTPFLFLLPAAGNPRSRRRLIGLVVGGLLLLTPFAVALVERDWGFFRIAVVVVVLTVNRSRILWNATEAQKNHLRLRVAASWVAYLGFMVLSLYLSSTHGWPGDGKYVEFHLAGALHFLTQGLYDPLRILRSGKGGS